MITLCRRRVFQPIYDIIPFLAQQRSQGARTVASCRASDASTLTLSTGRFASRLSLGVRCGRMPHPETARSGHGFASRQSAAAAIDLL
jgi:hypothetical protein